MLEHTSVAVTGLRKSYGKRPVLAGVSLEVRRGSRTVVLVATGFAACGLALGQARRNR
ncbi:MULTISPECIES: hypothetical protein [Nocardiopsidaceae]|uniref:ABC transporter n=1 Tax=Streptomonospora nanhaiensis TaxID=1323731 RepID=A0ABY6YUI8_9ACTN|nr:hypothetical protein [Streptomonospora nanhaiensis]WAE75873.1 hypothetical protein OUQ99_12695 [Streptomonospora nanhaiensis]